MSRSLRVPVWPGIHLTFGGVPKTDAVRVVMGGPRPPTGQRTVRIVSKRGWMVLLVRYDWQSAMPAPVKVRVIKDWDHC
jgi:hypothetical protein